MIFNPWFLAAAVFALIGAADEFQKVPEKKPDALPKKDKDGSGSVSVIVNNDGTKVKSPGKPKADAKPPAKVPPEPSGDG